MSGPDRLTPTDAMFLDVEDAAAHMHVGGLLVFEGAPPDLAAFIAHVAARLPRVPRFRQRLAFVPLHLGRPVWTDDAALDVARHVGRTVLAAPGGDAALHAAAARFLAEPLPRDRPLWQVELVEGLGPDRFALLVKVHHCLLDGIGGVEFVAAITDPAPPPPGAAPEPAAAWRPSPGPGAAALLLGALRERVLAPMALAREALAAGTRGRRLLLDLVAGARPLAALATSWPAPRWPLDARVGPERAFEAVSIDLGAAKEIRARAGGTVNDVLLAVVAGALRRLLLGRGDPVPGEIRVFVPVSVRPAGAREASGNPLALVLCPLPLGEPDPVARLRLVSAATRRLRDERQAVGVLAFEHLGFLAPAAVAAEAIRLVVAMHLFHLVVSNIPGPATPRWLLGRRLVACHPAIPLARGQSLSVGLLSYAGAVDVGLLGGAERARDLAALARAIPDALAELLAAARARSPGPVAAPARSGRPRFADALPAPAAAAAAAAPPVAR